MSKHTSLKLITQFILFILLCSPALADTTWFFDNLVLGDCVGGATVTIRTYDAGFINNPANLRDTTIIVAQANGAWGGVSSSLPDGFYDVNVSATNPACSPGARGSSAAFNRQITGLIPIDLTLDVTLGAPFYLLSPGNGQTVVVNQTTFTWTSDYTAVTSFNVQVSTQSDFSTLAVNQTGILPQSYTLSAAQELPDNDYYWRVRASNGTHYFDTTENFTLSVAAHEATLSNFNPTNDSWVAQTSPAISFTTNVDATCRYASNPATPYASKTLMSTTGATTHQITLSSLSQGAHTRYFQCNTSTGVINVQDYHYTIKVDTTGPSHAAASISINNDAPYSLSTTLSLNWSGFFDAGIGVISNYYYSFTNNQGTTNGFSTAGTSASLTNANQGTVNVYVWARDSLGNIGNSVTSTIIVDTLPPTFSHWSSNPTDLTKYHTGNYDVNFRVTDTSTISQVVYRYRVGDDNWTNWQSATYISGVNPAIGINYRITVQEQNSPNTWFERNGENLTYQINTTDTHGFMNSITRNEFINNESMPPELDFIANQVVLQDELLIFNLTGRDPDLNDLEYTCNITSIIVTKNNNTHATARWTPDNSEVGIHPVTCSVTDELFTTSRTFTITVIDVNDPPVLVNIGPLYAHEYVLFNYTLNASDPDNDILIFASNFTSYGWSLNRLTGYILFNPTAQHRGTHKINFSVDDSRGGVDYEEILLTVGWCGDGVCRAGFENCSSCELDCGICETTESKSIVLEPRNCLDQDMSIQAVSLVGRATCEEKGEIIHGLEVCGVEAASSLKTYIYVEGAWEEISVLITDEEGRASFKPVEEGDYKIAFSSDADIFTLFEAKRCVDGVYPGTTQPAPSTPPRTDQRQPPTLEEPKEIEEEHSDWGAYTFLLFFVIVPLLFILLVVSAMSYFYVQEKKKEQSAYAQFIDTAKATIKLQTKKITVWMDKTTPFNYLIDVLRLTIQEIKKLYTVISHTIVATWSGLIISAGMKTQVKIPYYPLDVPVDKREHLAVLGIIKHFRKAMSVDKILANIYSFAIHSLYDIAALCMTQSLGIRIFDPKPHDVAYLKKLVSKGAVYKRRKATRIDIERALIEGKPMICQVKEAVDGRARHVFITLYAFDTNHFYYHEYQNKKLSRRVAKDQFMKSWDSVGHRALVISKK